MKMFIHKEEPAEKNVVRIDWKRDAETFNLLSLKTNDNQVIPPAFPLQVFRETDAWYQRMDPEDAGKELWLLKEVYQKGSGRIRYRMRGLDGTTWHVTESMKLESSKEGKQIIKGFWICEKK